MEEGKVENWFEPKRRDSRSVRALILDGTDDILFDVRFLYALMIRFHMVVSHN